MVGDTEWNKQVWEEAREPRAEQTVAEDSLRETGKTKRGNSEGEQPRESRGRSRE